MNLEQSDSFKDEIEKNTRRRKGVMLSIVLCACLIAFLFILIMILKYQDSITEKLFLDDIQISIPSGLYRDFDGTTYINLKEIASILGYSYKKGEYNKFNENEDSAYLENDFETVAVSAERTKYEKYLKPLSDELTIADIPVMMKSDPEYYEVFEIEKPIKFVDNNIYVPLDSLGDMFNVQISWTQYRKKIYSLEYVIQNSKATIAKLEYNQISGYYENLRGLLYGYAIVGNGTTAEDGSEEKPSTLFGVINLQDGKETISVKYSDIKFIQNSKEFYVTTSTGSEDSKDGIKKMGILSADGGTILQPKYEEISILDAENQLYLVKQDDKYGVINRTGEEVVYVEYDEIGYDITDFKNEDIENPALLFGKVIPVKGLSDEGLLKYGLYNLEGDLVLSVSYDSLGYKVLDDERASTRESNLLLIPQSVGINGIVVCLDGLYGIFDVNKEELILPCAYSKIYSITRAGVTTYYAEFNGQQIELSQYLKDNNLVSVEEETDEKANEGTTENTNTVQDTNTIVVEENEVVNDDQVENVEESTHMQE